MLTSKQVTRLVSSLAPSLYSWYKAMKLGHPPVDSSAGETQLRLLEKQALLSPYGGTFADFSEMAIQFGYLTLFAAAFPFGAVICFVSNLAERKADATKLLSLTRRPRYRGAEDIGTWEAVFVLISKVAVVTNALIILFTSRLTSTALQDAFATRTNAFAFIVFVEHLAFAAQALIAHLVPDVPFWVDAARTRKDVMRRERLRLLAGDAAEHELYDDDDDDDNDGLRAVGDEGSDDDEEGHVNARGVSEPV